MPFYYSPQNICNHLIFIFLWNWVALTYPNKPHPASWWTCQQLGTLWESIKTHISHPQSFILLELWSTFTPDVFWLHVCCAWAAWNTEICSIWVPNCYMQRVYHLGIISVQCSSIRLCSLFPLPPSTAGSFIKCWESGCWKLGMHLLF